VDKLVNKLYTSNYVITADHQGLSISVYLVMAESLTWL